MTEETKKRIFDEISLVTPDESNSAVSMDNLRGQGVSVAHFTEVVIEIGRELTDLFQPGCGIAIVLSPCGTTASVTGVRTRDTEGEAK